MKKSLALMQHLGLPYFTVDGHWFQGNEEEEFIAFGEWAEKMDKYPSREDFAEWCFETLLLVPDEYTDIDDNYLVCDDDEAQEKTEIYISESVWAFNADFIVQHSSLPCEAIEMVEFFQREKNEGANETILALIDDFDDFVSDAINADGRGHFLSFYDGEENEETVNGETYYIYRN